MVLTLPNSEEAPDPFNQFGISASSVASSLDRNGAGLFVLVLATCDAERTRSLEGELGGLKRQRVLESFVSLSAFVAML